jgi:hypothetical protein
MSLCYCDPVLLRVVGRGRQLGHTADPHGINAGDVYQLGRVVVSQLQIVNDSDRSGLRDEGANERRDGEARGMQTRLP